MAKINKNLPVGTCIDNYVIEKSLAGGGFALVYVALDQTTLQRVVIKEYMPNKIAKRDKQLKVIPAHEKDQDTYNKGRKLFFNEASTLATLKHPNIVNVLNFFQENGTVYLVMEYEEGANLQYYIKSRNGNLSETFIHTVFPQLFNGLKAIHDHGLLHLDIKPGNIHLRPGGRPLLLDFGAVHSISLSRKHLSSYIITPGFSPIEQYDSKGYIGPWTDIYAIGATIRACIEGSSPLAADKRRVKDSLRSAKSLFKKRYSMNLLNSIDWAMEIDPLDRPQCIDELMTEFDVDLPTTVEAEPETMLDKIVNNFPWLK